MASPTLTRWQPYALGILRIVAGLIFLEHGTQKFLSFPAGEAAGAGWTLGHPGHYAGIIELVCGALIAIGLLTSVAAFLASGQMAVAYFKAHFPNGPLPILNQGELAVLYCFVFLYIAAAGSGIWSIDAAVARGRRR